MASHCPDDPAALLKQPICLSALSKNLKGDLDLNVSDPHTCTTPPCATLKTGHGLVLEVSSHTACDTHAGTIFNGTIKVDRLITAFVKDGLHRGLHAGDFVWYGTQAKAQGRMSGMTNVGTHRKPAFDACQVCDAKGVLEGRLCGEIVEAQNQTLIGCQILGVYRIRFEASEKGGGSGVEGTFEGVLVCPCTP